jgi:hypothetical protein
MLLRAFVAACLATQIVGCGDPVTDVYVVNGDDGRYFVAFMDDAGPSFRTEKVVNPGGAGLLIHFPGDVSGSVEVRGADCSLIGTARITSDATMVTIQDGGGLEVEDDADLSDVPADTMTSSAGCLGS